MHCEVKGTTEVSYKQGTFKEEVLLLSQRKLNEINNLLKKQIGIWLYLIIA